MRPAGAAHAARTFHDAFELRDVVRGIEQDQVERSARRARIQEIAADDSTRILLIRLGMRFLCHQAQGTQVGHKHFVRGRVLFDERHVPRAA